MSHRTTLSIGKIRISPTYLPVERRGRRTSLHGANRNCTAFFDHNHSHCPDSRVPGAGSPYGRHAEDFAGAWLKKQRTFNAANEIANIARTIGPNWGELGLGRGEERDPHLAAERRARALSSDLGRLQPNAAGVIGELVA